MLDYDELEALVLALPEDLRQKLFQRLRETMTIHPLEEAWNTTAEDLLEAISRGSDLTHRGVKGMLAEASFSHSVLSKLANWQDITPAGDHPFDYLIDDGRGEVKIQVKNQRSEKGQPLVRKRKYNGIPMYVVETQKTRSGEDGEGGKTRPYRVGEFDVLAVCLYPSTGEWTDFLYTVERWLLPRDDNAECLATFQPVPMPPKPNEAWTDDLEVCIEWFRSGREGTVMPSPPIS
jgi:hypothetical protein